MANSRAVSRLMALAGEIISSQSQVSLMGLALTQGHGAPLFSRRFSHHSPTESRGIRPRTDWLVVAAERLEERVQDGLRGQTSREKSSEGGRGGDISPKTNGHPDNEEFQPGSSEGSQEENGSIPLTYQAVPSTYRFPDPSDPRDEREDYLEDEEEED